MKVESVTEDDLVRSSLGRRQPAEVHVTGFEAVHPVQAEHHRIEIGKEI